jgi:hypothetical protein
MRTELEAFTESSFSDFWLMAVLPRGEVVPAWDDYVTDAMLARLRIPPAARVGGERLPGSYLYYLASSGEFPTFGEIRDFLVAEATRRRELDARGVKLYRDELREHLYALPAEDRLAIARFELSYPVEGPAVAQGDVELKIDEDHYDGAAFARLLDPSNGAR